jgi:hypothetical protein
MTSLPRYQIVYTEVRIICSAPEEVFTEEDFTKLPSEVQEAITQQRGLPCSGGGVLGDWCEDCHWGHIYDRDTYCAEDVSAEAFFYHDAGQERWTDGQPEIQPPKEGDTNPDTESDR